MTKALVCLHGNPLQGQEFEPLIPGLQGQGIHPIIHKRPLKGMKLEPLLQSITATAKVVTSSPFYLTAYSWGAYLALAYLNRYPENVAGVLLINPLLKAPAQQKKLLNAPILRTFALKFQVREWAATLLQRSFSPVQPPPALRAQLEKELATPALWRGYATYQKLLKNPLPLAYGPLPMPIHVLYGEQDEVAPLADQMPFLTKLASLTLHPVKGAGHALPWTHPSLLLDQIAELTSYTVLAT